MEKKDSPYKQTSPPKEPKPSKFFLASLPSNMTKEEIRRYFSQFGELKEIFIKKKSNRSYGQGHGVITFESLNGQKQDLIRSNHMICGRQITCEEYVGGSELEKRKAELDRIRVFISNIPKSMTDAELKETLMRFGRVSKAYRISKFGKPFKCRFGYAFFEDQESARKCLDIGYLVVKGVRMIFQPYTKNLKQKREMKDKRQRYISNSNYSSNNYPNPPVYGSRNEGGSLGSYFEREGGCEFHSWNNQIGRAHV